MFAVLTSTFYKLFPYMAACMARRREAQYTERAARRRQARYVRLSLEGLEERVVPAINTYIGPAGGAWTNDQFWSLGTVPGAMDTAVIPGGSSCVLNSTTEQTVAGLTVNGSLEVGSKLSVTTMSTTGTFTLDTGGELDDLSSADFGGTGTLSGQVDAQGATVTFDPGSSMTLASGVSLTGSGVFDIFGPVTCNAALSLESTMILDANGSSTAGALAGPGSMSVSGEFDWEGGALGLTGGASFIASADLKIEGADAKVLTAGTLTNQCNGSEIGGTGTLTIDPGATFDNLGNPSCDVTIPSIVVFSAQGNPASFINDADGFFDEQGSTTINGNFTNYGYLEVGAGANLTISSMGDANLDGHLLVDGDVTLLGSVLSPTGFALGPGSGTLQVGNGGTTSTLTIASGYEALLTGGTLEVTSTGTLTGAGTLDNNSGVVQLDLGSSTAGLGAFMQTTSGQLTLQAGVMNQNSSLNVTGNASLHGTLNLDFVGGYTPPSGTVFPVLAAGAISGEFNVTPPDMTPTYVSNAVTLTEN